jgi:hypothetical protein
MDSFLADGMSPEQAEIRVEQFLSNPEMSVNIIWEAERKRFVEEEKVCLRACCFAPLRFCVCVHAFVRARVNGLVRQQASK